MRISDWSSDVCSSDLARDLPLGAAGEALVHAVEHKAQQGAAAVHIVCKEVVEMILHRIFDKPRGFWTGEPVLGLALELRVADKDRTHHLRAREDVLCLYAVRDRNRLVYGKRVAGSVELGGCLKHKK